ncbi:hypothetical protein PFTANZ_00053 [Plasmodium falciparum Tanzania (2000708)]|uniref:Uncharacterized protein n=1 Tax=Plasmodium falciparum Tanzania (2000708) TaxID=1036725 RepID=A0A024WEZ2_PLAFA|nr:hypothetical protein PFTANZ_00053 [Plasmodium falciparum Tanzania (2000708)]
MLIINDHKKKKKKEYRKYQTECSKYKAICQTLMLFPNIKSLNNITDGGELFKRNKYICSHI